MSRRNFALIFAPGNGKSNELDAGMVELVEWVIQIKSYKRNEF